MLFKYGLASYIPVEILGKILPDLCELVKEFESLLEIENSHQTDPVNE